MPVKDVDGGLVWQGYDPRLFTGKLPQDKYVEKPFYFGGSQVPTDLGLPKNSYSGTGMSCSQCKMRAIKKLPNIRK